MRTVYTLITMLMVSSLAACGDEQNLEQIAETEDHAKGCGAHQTLADTFEICEWRGAPTLHSSDIRLRLSSSGVCLGTAFVDCVYKLHDCAWQRDPVFPAGPACLSGTNCPAKPDEALKAPQLEKRFELKSGDKTCEEPIKKGTLEAFCNAQIPRRADELGRAYDDLVKALIEECKSTRSSWGEATSVNCCVAAPEPEPPHRRASTDVEENRVNASFGE